MTHDARQPAGSVSPLAKRPYLVPALITIVGGLLGGCELEHADPAGEPRRLSEAISTEKQLLHVVAQASARVPQAAPPKSFGCSRLTTQLTRYPPEIDLQVGSLSVPLAWKAKGADPVQLLLHFHSHEAVVADLDRGGVDIAVLGLEAPAGTYDKVYGGLVIKSALAHARGTLRYLLKMGLADDVWRRRGTLVLGAWSTGFPAIRRLLSEADHGVSAIIVIDGMHGVANDKDRVHQLRHVIQFARRAADNDTFFFLSHSAVKTTGFASTEDSATSMLEALFPDGVPDGAAPSTPAPALPSGTPTRNYHQGGLTVLGYSGDDGDAHCDQLGLYPYAIALFRAWLDQRETLSP